MELIKNVFKKSLIVILPAVAIAFFYDSGKLPLGIFLGWLFGVINLRALSRNVAGMIGSEGATVKMLFLNMTRMLFMIAAISMLVYYTVVNPFGLLIGFTVVFSLIIIEGMKTK